MFSVPMASLVGHGVRCHGGGGAMCRRSETWRIGPEKVSGIFVGTDRKGRKESKILVMATEEFTIVIFLYSNFLALGDADIEELTFLELLAIWCGSEPPGVSRRNCTCRVK